MRKINLLRMVADGVGFLNDVELHRWIVVVVQGKQKRLLGVNVTTLAIRFGKCHIRETSADGSLSSL